MGRIYCIVGKSASGKDTLYRNILALNLPRLSPVTPYTTRPRRSGERDGDEYRFVTEEDLARMEAAGQVVEKRVYQTVRGPWTYFTPAFPLLPEQDYLLITTLEGLRGIAAWYGREAVRAVCLEVDDKTRRRRCKERERCQENPDYKEMNRRFLADQRDFAPEKLAEFPNLVRLDANRSPEACLKLWMELYETQ